MIVYLFRTLYTLGLLLSQECFRWEVHDCVRCKPRWTGWGKGYTTSYPYSRINRLNIDKTNKQANEEIKNVLLDFFWNVSICWQ